MSVWVVAAWWLVAGGVVGVGRRDSLEFGSLQEYARKWGGSALSPPLGAALGPVGLRPGAAGAALSSLSNLANLSAAPGAETAKFRYTHTHNHYVQLPRRTLGCFSSELLPLAMMML